MRAPSALALLLLLIPVSRPAAAEGKPRDCAPLLEPIRARHDVPGMAGAVVEGDRLVALGATGVRVRGKEPKVTVEDRWHLGSCTKAMTATLCGMLVEEKRLSWTATVGGAFPDLAPAMDPKWKGVTLEQLLTHRGGAPAELKFDDLWNRLRAFRGSPVEARRVLLEGVVARSPLFDPGTAFTYSNAGYAIAGAMAEGAAGKPWEALLRERIFRPLGMESAGFGAPGSAKAMDEPWGHRDDGTPIPPGPSADNPAAIGPASTVHTSIADWAKFAALHLRGDRGEARLLRKETFARLHEPADGRKEGYAMGWGVAVQPGSGGRVLTHAGSNTMWYCVAWIAPERDFAVLVCCNRGGDAAEKACEEASGALVQEHLARGKPASEPAGGK